jgi:hypothetical protein
MFIAMNRFKVKKGSEHDFEQVWLTRKTHLDDVPGFVVFHLLKGPERDDMCSTPRTPSGVLRRSSRLGRGPKPSARRMAGPAPTSRYISATLNSKALPSCKR